MTYNRRRNIFSLGDFHQYPNPTQQIKAQLNRRQNSDPFERDPFKIQSYNFRYAERPSSSLANLANSCAQPSHQSPSSQKRFETFFYNYDFTSSVHDKENSRTNKFREFRRRKFLLDHQQQNPTTATMHERLHPNNGNGTRRTAAESATAAANPGVNSGRASLSGSEYERMRGSDNGGRHHQTLGCATDTSSIGTSGVPRAEREYVGTTSQKYGRTTNACSTGNREYMRALASAHIGASAQPNYLGRGRCNSPSTLEYIRQLRVEATGDGRVIRQQGYNSNGSLLDSAKGADFQELSCSRASSSKHVRQPLHTIRSASPNRVTTTVEKSEDTCSGCQINISIKGLDSTELGDNVVIKIESDNNTPTKMSPKTDTKNAQHTIAKLMEIRHNSEMNRNLDIKPGTFAHQQRATIHDSSSASFVIDKSLSKFAMTSSDERELRKFRPRSSSHSRLPVTSSTARVMGFASFTNPMRVPNSSEGINRNAKNLSNERMPSMVPWRLDTTVRHGFSQDDDVMKPAHARASSPIKHSRPSYDVTLSDVRKIRRQAVVAAYKPLSLQRTPNTTRKAEDYGSGGCSKASSTAADSEKGKQLTPGKAAASWKADDVRHRQSHHSLRGLKESKDTVNSHPNSQMELRRSPTMILRPSRSNIRPGQTTQFATDSQSHLSVKTTPVNVNINVFADKLKLLRV
ncbi:uncharacterized protein LOC128867196 [Anastrepha ludens]|uniref:uncharacterized protein LOC128867196 n=1 Tax=Anastrepha ludens TaxID=28586 RepID=UPI0023AF6038|nr:uncharacterized protein LOC128867196 [Anastrepha ludens]